MQSKKVRFEDEDNANKQGDVIEDKSMKGNQGKYVDMICWIKSYILVARSMEISRVLYYFIFAGSASGASCKDETANKQRNKDDHNDSGSNDGANDRKKTNKAEPASKQSGMQLVLKASNNLYWFSSIFSFWRQQQLMFYVFFKYLLNHHHTKISLVINLKVRHPRMMIKVQRTTIKQQRMTTKHQRMMLASEMMESEVNIRFLSVQQQFLYQ